MNAIIMLFSICPLPLLFISLTTGDVNFFFLNPWPYFKVDTTAFILRPYWNWDFIDICYNVIASCSKFEKFFAKCAIKKRKYYRFRRYIILSSFSKIITPLIYNTHCVPNQHSLITIIALTTSIVGNVTTLQICTSV